MSDARARLAALRPKVHEVRISGDPDPYHVRGLNGRERAHLIHRMAEAKAGGKPISDADIVVLGVCNAEGVRTYGDTAEDLREAEDIDGVVLSELAVAILRHSGMTADAGKDAEKN